MGTPEVIPVYLWTLTRASSSTFLANLSRSPPRLYEFGPARGFFLLFLLALLDETPKYHVATDTLSIKRIGIFGFSIKPR